MPRWGRHPAAPPGSLSRENREAHKSINSPEANGRLASGKMVERGRRGERSIEQAADAARHILGRNEIDLRLRIAWD